MNDLHELIKGKVARFTNLDDKKSQLNLKTMGTIRLWIDQSVYYYVAKKSRANVL